MSGSLLWVENSRVRISFSPVSRNLLIKSLLLLAGLWVLVWGGMKLAGGRTATAERAEKLIAKANFEDRSEAEGSADEKKRRREDLKEFAEVLNRMDLRERERMREKRVGEDLFNKLSSDERTYFVELTLTASMKRMMQAFDEMEPEKRNKFAQRALKNMEEGRDGADLAEMREENPELLRKITAEGMKAFYQDSSAETKLDLAPVMEAFSEAMQGFSGGGGRE